MILRPFHQSTCFAAENCSTSLHCFHQGLVFPWRNGGGFHHGGQCGEERHAMTGVNGLGSPRASQRSDTFRILRVEAAVDRPQRIQLFFCKSCELLWKPQCTMKWMLMADGWSVLLLKAQHDEIRNMTETLEPSLCPVDYVTPVVFYSSYACRRPPGRSQLSVEITCVATAPETRKAH